MLFSWCCSCGCRVNDEFECCCHVKPQCWCSWNLGPFHKSWLYVCTSLADVIACDYVIDFMAMLLHCVWSAIEFDIPLLHCPAVLSLFVGLHFDQLHEVTWVWMLNANAAVQTWCYIQINSHDHDCFAVNVYGHARLFDAGCFCSCQWMMLFENKCCYAINHAANWWWIHELPCC